MTFLNDKIVISFLRWRNSSLVEEVVKFLLDKPEFSALFYFSMQSSIKHVKEEGGKKKPFWINQLFGPLLMSTL